MTVPLMSISESKSKMQVKLKLTILNLWKEHISYIATAQFAMEVCGLLVH